MALSLGEDARAVLFTLIDRYLAEPDARDVERAAAASVLPPQVVADLDRVLGDSRISYRDGVAIQLGWGVNAEGLDLTRRPPGSRTLAQELGKFLAERHIRHVKDAYQNIAKNTEVLTRGNFAEFDSLLGWASGASVDDRSRALTYACAAIAATARPVSPMPTLNRSALSFARTAALLGGLLDTRSGGAFEQFAVAALLNTLVGDIAGNAYRVETKSLNASDHSSSAAGDVQIMTGNRVIEAFEVTANDWRTKLAGASKTIRDNDLSRLHIVAARPRGDGRAVELALADIAEDVSVLDVRELVNVLAAILTRPQRAAALARLYEYLDRYQSDVGKVNLLVERLHGSGLVEGGGD